jgi:hypothetical protein
MANGDDRAAEYRKRASEIRRRAETIEDRAARQEMLEITAVLERWADRRDKKARVAQKRRRRARKTIEEA